MNNRTARHAVCELCVKHSAGMQRKVPVFGSTRQILATLIREAVRAVLGPLFQGSASCDAEPFVYLDTGDTWHHG